MKKIIILSLLCAGTFGIATSVFAAAGSTTTQLGKIYSGDGGSALTAYIDAPGGVVAKADGTLFLADTKNNAIRTINASGTITTFSGTGEYGIKNGARTSAFWSEPEGIAMSSSGTFYIADTGSSSIRTIVGTNVTKLPIAGLRRPNAVIVNGSTLIISDTGNNRVVSVSAKGGKVAVLADKLKTPMKLASDGTSVYVVENGSGKILAINLKTKKKTVLASGFTEPRVVTLWKGKLYVAAGPSGIYNELWTVNPKTKAKKLLARRRETELLNLTSDLTVAKINGAERLVQTQSGGSAIYTTDLRGNDLTLLAGKHRFEDEPGAASVALLGRPKALAISNDSTKLYVSYGQGNKIALYDMSAGTVTQLAGNLMDNYREGVGANARFSDVASMVLSPDGTTLYLADRNSQRIRTLNVTTGETTYLTGAGITNLISPDSATGAIDTSLNNGYQEGGPCPDTTKTKVKGCAYFNRPTGLALTKDGTTLYVADASNNRVRKVTVATGKTSFVAGSGKAAYKDGVGVKASFNGPTSLALSADEKSLYVADKYNNVIRQVVLATQKVTTLAGTSKNGYREGSFAKAVFSIPEYLALGPDGNLYVSEAGTLRLRKLNLSKKVTTLFSGSGQRGMKNGAAGAAEWNGPKAIVFTATKAIVADFQNDLLRSVDLGLTSQASRRR